MIALSLGYRAWVPRSHLGSPATSRCTISSSAPRPQVIRISCLSGQWATRATLRRACHSRRGVSWRKAGLPLQLLRRPALHSRQALLECPEEPAVHGVGLVSLPLVGRLRRLGRSPMRAVEVVLPPRGAAGRLRDGSRAVGQSGQPALLTLYRRFRPTQRAPLISGGSSQVGMTTPIIGCRCCVMHCGATLSVFPSPPSRCPRGPLAVRGGLANATAALGRCIASPRLPGWRLIGAGTRCGWRLMDQSLRRAASSTRRLMMGRLMCGLYCCVKLSASRRGAGNPFRSIRQEPPLCAS